MRFTGRRIEALEFLMPMVESPPVVLAKLRLLCQDAKIKNFTPLLEIKRDFRRRRAEYETRERERERERERGGGV